MSEILHLMAKGQSAAAEMRNAALAKKLISHVVPVPWYPACHTDKATLAGWLDAKIEAARAERDAAMARLAERMSARGKP